MDRESTLADFKSDVCNLLIATSVAARGLDVKVGSCVSSPITPYMTIHDRTCSTCPQELTLVVNYDVPNHHEDYVHRVGRTGRAGNKGTAITFIGPDEEKFAPDLVKALKQSGATVPQDLQAMAEEFTTKRKAGLVQGHSSGFGGTGFKFNDKEEEARRAQRKVCWYRNAHVVSGRLLYDHHQRVLTTCMDSCIHRQAAAKEYGAISSSSDSEDERLFEEEQVDLEALTAPSTAAAPGGTTTAVTTMSAPAAALAAYAAAAAREKEKALPVAPSLNPTASAAAERAIEAAAQRSAERAAMLAAEAVQQLPSVRVDGTHHACIVFMFNTDTVCRDQGQGASRQGAGRSACHVGECRAGDRGPRCVYRHPAKAGGRGGGRDGRAWWRKRSGGCCYQGSEPVVDAARHSLGGGSCTYVVLCEIDHSNSQPLRTALTGGMPAGMPEMRTVFESELEINEFPQQARFKVCTLCVAI